MVKATLVKQPPVVQPPDEVHLVLDPNTAMCLRACLGNLRTAANGGQGYLDTLKQIHDELLRITA